MRKHRSKSLALVLCFAFLLFLGCKTAVLDLCPGDFSFYKTKVESTTSHLPKCHQTAPGHEKKASKEDCDCPLAFQELRNSEPSFSLEKLPIQRIKIFFSFYQADESLNPLFPFSHDFFSKHSIRYFSSTDHFLDSVRLII
ncbi:hypothetical protein [Leptospira ilyithenensis]|uniref:Lipoprotein n=1 Tax=Leptospira ilyithenensis TaxID=2484901 RepID=A0A4R9LST1_9LEPT|nr:hypothetical protein [Leptospira ilyithenensis]TGN14513.1 hypothetical protein EHS11_00520 [Leptospira ilyithenensis]